MLMPWVLAAGMLPAGMLPGGVAYAGTLKAGTGRCNITAPGAGKVHDSLYVKALVLEEGGKRTALITLDVVAVGTIGDIPSGFLEKVRKGLRERFRIGQVMVNASHNHLDGFLNGGGKISPDVSDLTLKAVETALGNLEPVRAGAGSGRESSFVMNRRIKLKDGTVFTIRHANPDRPDSLVMQPGETDPEIVILKLERMDGTPKAVVYNYACHPYTGVPDKSVTAEYPGIASALIERELGGGAMAFFLQGAAGDITEILYKDVNAPRSCEPFGIGLGLRVLAVAKSTPCSKKTGLSFVSEICRLPLRKDMADRIRELENENGELLMGLRSTSLNMKTFIPLYLKYALSPTFPSGPSYAYGWEEMRGLPGLEKMDEMNRRDMDKYMRNILSMEKLAENVENIAQLRLRQEEIERHGGDSVAVELLGLRVGDFAILSFPGEPFARVGLEVKSASPLEFTCLAGYTNGYIHYAPLPGSYREGGYETMNCILAPEWLDIYRRKVRGILGKL